MALSFFPVQRLVPLACSLALLAGCASSRPVAPADWQHGARPAEIVKLYGADDVTQLPPCLAGLPAADYAARHYARLRYRHGRLLHYEVAELTPALDAGTGDVVELWPANCAAGQLSRVSKVLARAPR